MFYQGKEGKAGGFWNVVPVIALSEKALLKRQNHDHRAHAF